MPFPPLEIPYQIGLLLLTAVVFGRIARFVGIPRIAGYLAGGLVVGPQIAGFIAEEVVTALQPLTQFALALIMFNIGVNFQFNKLKIQVKWLLPLIAADIIGAFTFVFGLTWLAGASLALALLLGILAMETAPATTLLVIKEFDSEGDVTDSLITMIGFNITVCIIAFEIALALLKISFFHSNTIQTANSLIFSILSAPALGIGGGIVIGYLEQKVRGAERLILFLGLITLIFGLCFILDISYMLVFLLMGVTLVNTSEFAQEILLELDKIGLPLYVLFFLVAGVKLQLDSLQSLGIVSAAYFLARIAGKFGAVRFAVHKQSAAPETAKFIPRALLSQAGIALGLTITAAEELPEIGIQLQTIIVSLVMIFEIIGPLLVKSALIQAGEVKIEALLDRPDENPYSFSLKVIFRKFLASLGLAPLEKPENLNRLKVFQVMRKNFHSVPVSAPFPEILNFIAHNRYNYFPVTAENSVYEGLISYPEVREAIYYPSLAKILIAKDLVRWKDARISPDAGLIEALEIFHKIDLDFLPVVDNNSGKLIGLLEQREVLRLCGKSRMTF